MITQIIYNMVEQQIGRRLIPAATVRRIGLMARAPHASGRLEGRAGRETTVGAGVGTDGRKRTWLEGGRQNLEPLRFLTADGARTMAQAAIRFILAEPCFACVLPNIYNEAQLEEFAGASGVPDLTPEELWRVAELYERNFQPATG